MSSPVEQIKSRLSLIDVVQSYIKLQKAGANFKANCPFHNEKTPSFVVSPSREIWHCFGCGRGGDLIGFVKEIEGVEFPEALQILANRAGITLSKEDPRLRTEKTRLFELTEASSLFFESELKNDQSVIKYLKDRGVVDATINNFRIGYAKDSWDALLNHLKNLGYREPEIEKAGLAIHSDKNTSHTHYDRFRSRITFPIADSMGRIVGFSGRIFQESSLEKRDAEPAKYINTPQTLLYDKSRILYGFDKAKNDIRKEDKCIVVEGQMDVVMSHQAGICNVVAVSGTALTQPQLTIIKRLSNNLLTAFDMDSAGGLATKRGIDLALSMDMDVGVIVMKSGDDPADLVKEDPKLWKKRIQESKHIIDFYMDMLQIKYADDARELKNKTSKIVLPYVAMLNNEMEKDHWIGEIARRLKMQEDPIRDEVRKHNTQTDESYSEEEQPQSSEKIKTRKDLLEERLLGIFSWKKDEVKDSFKDIDFDIFSDNTKPIIQAAIAGTSKNIEAPINYLNKLAFEAELLYADTTELDVEVADLLAGLAKEHTKERMAELASSIRSAEIDDNQELLSNLANEFKELSRKLL